MEGEIIGRESRLREHVATSFPARTLVFGVVLAVAVLLILICLTREDSWGPLAVVILVLIAISSLVNLVLATMWCSNKSWGKGRQLVCWGPCGLCCDERDEFERGEDDTEKAVKRAGARP